MSTPPKRGAGFGAICQGVITSFISCPSPPDGAPTFPSICWEGLGRSRILELCCWPHSACPLHPPHRLLCSCHWCNEFQGLSCTGLLALSLGSSVGTCLVELRIGPFMSWGRQGFFMHQEGLWGWWRVWTAPGEWDRQLCTASPLPTGCQSFGGGLCDGRLPPRQVISC